MTLDSNPTESPEHALARYLDAALHAVRRSGRHMTLGMADSQLRRAATAAGQVCAELARARRDVERLRSEYATAYEEWQKTADVWKERAEKAQAQALELERRLAQALEVIGQLRSSHTAHHADADGRVVDLPGNGQAWVGTPRDGGIGGGGR